LNLISKSTADDTDLKTIELAVEINVLDSAGIKQASALQKFAFI